MLEVDSQNGGRFTATAFLRGARIPVTGEIAGDTVTFREAGGLAFEGRKTSRGGWQGTFTREDGATRAQWFLQPL